MKFLDIATLKSGLTKKAENWRGKKNQAVIPALVPKKPVPPQKTTSTVEFRPTSAFVDEPLTLREMQSRAKMNSTKKKRQQMKAHNKKQKKCNPRHGKRS